MNENKGSMERRDHERVPSALAVQVFAGDKTWKGICINLSSEGALLKLSSLWDGGEELDLQLHHDAPAGPTMRAHVVRSSSPDSVGSFLAVKFLGPSVLH